jgi:hypothetical protein
MVAVFCSCWLLLQDNHWKFSDIAGPFSGVVYVADQLCHHSDTSCSTSSPPVAFWSSSPW